MSIVLIGYRGSGKSTIGRKLADRLWQDFLDIDDLIVKRAGKSIKEIFEQEGEEAFREIESLILADLLKLPDAVISLGGGTLNREQNRRAIQAGNHKIIYLRCDSKVLHDRIHADPATAATRPALTALGGGLEEIEQMIARREPFYRQVMTAELDVTNLSVEEAVVYIVRLL